MVVRVWGRVLAGAGFSVTLKGREGGEWTKKVSLG